MTEEVPSTSKSSDYSPEAKSFHIITETFKVVGRVVTFGGWALIVYVGIALPIIETSGQETTIRYVVDIIGRFRLDVVIPYTAAAAFFALWRRERHLRKTTVYRENRRNKTLEKKIDPNRTTSGFKEVKPPEDKQREEDHDRD